jgi:hypothetical protein
VGKLLPTVGINFDINVIRAILGRNCDVAIGRAACEACSATWILRTNSAFTLGSRKPRKTLIDLSCREKVDDPFFPECLVYIIKNDLSEDRV